MTMNESKRGGRSRWLPLVVVAILALAAGYIIRGGGSGRVEHAHDGEETATEWTCSMHPQIRQPEFGSCPICGMDLIPATSGDAGDAGAREITLSATARKLASIETAAVERQYVSVDVRMVGKVVYDESRVKHITAWVPGRLDRLFVDYTGMTVREGDHMVDLYSPALLAAQEELIQARKAAGDLEKSRIVSMRQTSRATVDAAREKLRLWGLNDDQVRAIEESGSASDRLTIHAPMSGIVIEKHAAEGMYVETGSHIYTIADLSQLWVKLDAYESDLPWLRYGQDVEFRTEAYPGEPFTGTIAFIEPVLDPKTRTVKVRVNVSNPDAKLKPGMFVRGLVRAGVAKGGRVMDPDLAGKWICPMHPEIVADEETAECDICGMPLVTTESLGYEPVDPDEEEAPLVIPASAPLITGTRAIVYVERPGGEGTYEGREIQLGPRAGDSYIVMGGLEEGERVVTRGNFKIDSANQILAKPSMMSPPDGASDDHAAHEPVAIETYDTPDAFKLQIDDVLNAYFAIHEGLSGDSLMAARAGAKTMIMALDSVDMTLLDGDAHDAWMTQLEKLHTSADAIAATDNIEKARIHFEPLAGSMTTTVRLFGTTGALPVIRFHCPMAFNWVGADWIQNRKGVENPYFGAQMYRCGTEEETIVAGVADGVTEDVND